MTLKEQIKEIAIDLAYWSYHNTVLEDYKDTDKKVEKATNGILKVVELDEGKIARILRKCCLPSKNFIINDKFFIELAKAIAHGDVYKNRREG